MFSRIAFCARLSVRDTNYSHAIFVNKLSRLNNVVIPTVNNFVNWIHANSKVLNNNGEDSPGNGKRKRDKSEDNGGTVR